MNIFEFNAKELVILSALIADQISLEYSLEQQEIIAVFLRSISENVSIYIATEAFRKVEDEKHKNKI